MAYFRIDLSNGYCNCDESFYIEASNEEAAEEIADDATSNYANDYSYLADGCSLDDGGENENEESEATYQEDITCTVVEVSKEEFDAETEL